MRKTQTKSRMSGFTLIELLIVVLIIAILAAIAVPNFLEFQTRAKVSRSASDIRSLRTAVEAYRVDFDDYPETDVGVSDITMYGVGLIRVTTPIAYMTTIPRSPWTEKFGNGGTPQNAHFDNMNSYLWVTAKHTPGETSDNSPMDNKDDNYNTDRVAYLSYGVSILIAQVRSQGEWMIKSVGPNNCDDRDASAANRPDCQLGANARVYDPTNGTISNGDLIVFSDSQSFVGGN